MMVGTWWKAPSLEECYGAGPGSESVDDGLPVDPIRRLDHLQDGLRQCNEYLILRLFKRMHERTCKGSVQPSAVASASP